LTAHDFIDQYLHRLKLPADQLHGLRISLNFLVAQAAIDFRIALLPPSMIAAICLQVASARMFGESHVTHHRIGMALGKMIALVMDPTKPYAAAIHELAFRHQNAFTFNAPNPHPPPVLRQLQLLPSFSATFTQLTKIDPSVAGNENFATATTPTDMNDVMLF